MPGRHPLTTIGPIAGRTALAVALPAGYTRLLVPAYATQRDAPALPLFGYTFACAVDDRLLVAAMKTDESDDWKPRRFKRGELEGADRAAARTRGRATACSSRSRSARASTAALPRRTFFSNAAKRRCRSPRSAMPAASAASRSRTRTPAYRRRKRASSTRSRLRSSRRWRFTIWSASKSGIVSFRTRVRGRAAAALGHDRPRDRAHSRRRGNGTINSNTNGSQPHRLARCIDAGLQAVRISLNSFRPQRLRGLLPSAGIRLEDVFESIRSGGRTRARVSLNLLTHPGVTDDVEEIEAMEAFLREAPVAMIQTRTLNIDPALYFETVGRPRAPLGMRRAIAAMRAVTRIGNFTHTH